MSLNDERLQPLNVVLPPLNYETPVLKRSHSHIKHHSNNNPVTLRELEQGADELRQAHEVRIIITPFRENDDPDLHKDLDARSKRACSDLSSEMAICLNWRRGYKTGKKKVKRFPRLEENDFFYNLIQLNIEDVVAALCSSNVRLSDKIECLLAAGTIQLDASYPLANYHYKSAEPAFDTEAPLGAVLLSTSQNQWEDADKVKVAQMCDVETHRYNRFAIVADLLLNGRFEAAQVLMEENQEVYENLFVDAELFEKINRCCGRTVINFFRNRVHQSSSSSSSSSASASLESKFAETTLNEQTQEQDDDQSSRSASASVSVSRYTPSPPKAHVNRSGGRTLRRLDDDD